MVDTRKSTRTWFDLGANALARVRPQLPLGYGCPLCRRLFETPDGLTKEHVPPESMGGRPLVLTCDACNKRGGHELDHHIRTAANIRELFDGKRPGRGTFTQYGKTLNADIAFGSTRTIRVAKQNNPAAIKAILDGLQRDIAAKSTPPEIDLGFAFPYDEWKEQVAWLRIGYLYAFAALGYRFALQAVLQPVHEQITRPAEKLLPGLVRPVLTPVRKGMGFVREPSAVRSVLVSLGDRLVFLPGLGDDLTFYNRMAAVPRKGEGFRIQLALFSDLPQRPVFWFDFDEAALRRIMRRLAQGGQQ